MDDEIVMFGFGFGEGRISTLDRHKDCERTDMTSNLVKAICTSTLLVVAVGASAAASDTFMNGKSRYGEPATSEVKTRVVNVDDAKYLNVRYGEAVTLRSAGREFSWVFNGVEQQSVDLSRVAPPGFVSKAFVIYVPADPQYRR